MGGIVAEGPRLINDLPGYAGLSPYQIVFGRERPMQGAPYWPRYDAVDSERWIEQRREMLQGVSDRLNDVQERTAGQVNRNRRAPRPLTAGARVWYKPERKEGTDKLEPRWKGPGIVLERVSRDSYILEAAEKGRRTRVAAHRDQL